MAQQRRMIQRPNGVRCPNCGGPVANGEGYFCCVVCGFRRYRAR